GFSQGQIDWWHGLIMIILLLGYIALAANQRSEAFAVEGDAPAIQAIGAGMITLFLIVGFAAILGGSELLVSGSVGLAEQLGIPNEIIGLTVIAIGTSLPEMATTFTAAWQRNTQLCFGNVIGSNLFNISGIAGLTALVAPLPISDDLLAIDLPILVATTLMLSVMMLWGRPIGRMTGFLLAAGYAAFIGMRVLSIVP
ncbi:MAG: sodium:calcium antiporter, partial [Rhodobacteraceae bacterium]|nr:sodium:calcium antiporter [Paracoccaceae bacterium]